MTTAASVLPLGGDAVLEQMRQGGEFSLHSLTSDRSAVQTRRIFLFLRDAAPQYGKAGCLYWTIVPSPTVSIAAFASTPESRAELSTQCLPLHTLTDLRSAKQTEVFKAPSLSRVSESLCFTLSANSGLELNLTAVSVEAKERWWNGVMIKLKEGKKQLKITNAQPNAATAAAAAGSSATPSPSPPPGSSAPAAPPSLSIPNGLPSSSSPPPATPPASLSPASLKRLLNSGAFFRKYDLDPTSQTVTVSSIFLWAEGVGKQGDLYWVEAAPSASFQPPPSHVLPASHSLPLSRITDFMLRKKSPALRASPAADSCCFALVSSDRFTLNLECESRDVCKNWREGLINMLLTAGKQVVRADAATTPTSGNGQQPASGSASPTAALAPSPALPRSQSEEREVFLLTTGAVFTLYYTNSRHQPEQAKITLFFVELLPPSEPGALCWCSVGSKRMIEGQRLMLNSMKQMISGCDHASFRHSLPGEGAQQLDPDCCFTVVGKSLILNLEAGSQSVREGWMKGLHGVMLRYQQAVQEKKRQAQEMASRAAREIIASNDASFAQAAAQSAAAQNIPPSPTSPALPVSRSPSPSLAQGAVQQASHSPSPSFSFPSPGGLEDQIARLRKGDQFTLYTASSSSPSDVQSHAIFLFFVEDAAGPGYLYYCAPPPAPRQLLDNQRFSLASLSKMVGGKETAIFQNERMRAVPVDRCLSIIGKHSMLNVEAKGVELRDLWIKTLHAIMTRYKSSRQQTPAPAAAAGLTPPTAGAAVTINGLHPAVLNSPGSSSPLVGSAPPSPSSANQPPVMVGNPLYNPAVPTSPPPASGLISPPGVPHLQPPSSPTTAPSLLSPASLASEPEAIFLSTPHPFKLYSASPVGFPLIIDVCLFFHPIAPPSPDSPGALFWSSPGRKELKDSQKLPLNRILQMAGGKDTLIFRHPAAAAVPRERCLYVTSATVSLSLEAPSAEAKSAWMQQLHALILKMGRQPVDDRRTPPASAPPVPRPGSSLTAPMNGGAPSPHHSPNANAASAGRPPSPLNPLVPAAAPLTPPAAGAPVVSSPSAAAAVPPAAASDAGSNSASSLSKSTVDIRTALQTVQTGQQFTLYFLTPSGETAAERFFFFFQPSTGSDQPGVLYWAPVDQQPPEADPKRRFVLNTIKQMRAGKDTPILKSAIAAKARSSHCLSLSSAQLTLNLEAPTDKIAELWRKSLHTVLVRHGMKAVEDQPAASAAASPAAAAVAPSTSPLVPVGAARPLSGAVATHINRTINFMDPTEFFSLRAKIGEGSYGAVYKAIDHRDGAAVAIKIIPFSGKDSLKLRKEIRTLRQCHSPFIVGYKGAFHKQENVWIVMEYCIAAGTPVALADGTALPIEAVRPGMRVLSRCTGDAVYADGLAPAVVEALLERGLRPCVELLFSDARTLTCTADHRILTPDGRWVEAGKLEVGVSEVAVADDREKEREERKDSVTDGVHRDARVLPLFRVKLVGRRAVGDRRVYDLSVPSAQGEPSRSFVANGVVVHNCAAGSLSDIMQINKRTLSELQISNVMKQSLAGLAYLHGQGKIHRDIKGGNILCDSNGMCKLADFGVSGNLDKTLGKHRTVIGTPHWMAPEVLMSDDYNELADIWSLGITAYELAIGEPPHAKLHSMRAALKIPMSPPPTLPDPGHWSDHFHSFLRSCLVKDFHARPSAIDLLSHPFVVNAANASVLMDMVRASVKAIEGKAAELGREQGLSGGGQPAAAGAAAAAGGGAAAAGGGRASGGRAAGSSGSAAAANGRDDATTVGMTGSSVGDVDDDIDADEDDVEEEQPRIRPNPRGSR